MSTVKANTLEPASGGTVTITGAALTTPALGTPASGTLTNCTGFPVANLSGTTMPSAVVNSSLNAITPSGGALTITGTLSTVGGVSSSRYLSTSSSDALPAYGVEAGSGIFNAGASTIGFSVGSSEQMRLTSTGLGIGTSSPAVKLHSYTSGNTPILSETSGGVTSYLGLKNTGGMAYIASQNNNILFATSSNADTRATLDASGNLLVGVASGSAHTLKKDVSQGTDIAVVTSNAGGRSALVLAVAAEGWNTADAAIWVGKNSVNNRSINAGGTVNASGADYAEYERNGGLKFVKGAIVGFDAQGVLTNQFSAAIRFGIKSTDPCLVGGDTWGTSDQVGDRPEAPNFTPPEYTGRDKPDDQHAIDTSAWQADQAAHAAAVQAARDLFDTVTMPEYRRAFAAFEARLEEARQSVDRISYTGKAPCNVTGASPGDYIIAADDGHGGITGVPVRSPTFAQYRMAVGRVNRILPDGRAEVAVMVH